MLNLFIFIFLMSDLLQGAVESISIGEIRLSLRKSTVKIREDFLSRDPKLHVLICDIEIVTRASRKGTQKKRSRSSRKTRKSGGGKLMAVANIARFLSITITKLAFRVSLV